MITATLYINVKLHTCNNCIFDYVNILLENITVTIHDKSLNFFSTTTNNKNINSNFTVIQSCNAKNLLYLNPFKYKISSDLKPGRIYIYDEKVIKNINIKPTSDLYILSNFMEGENKNTITIIGYK